MSKTLGSIDFKDNQQTRFKVRAGAYTPKHSNYSEKDLLNDRIVKDKLMPKFDMFGLGKILRVRLRDLLIGEP